jgi:two-component system response regulator
VDDVEEASRVNQTSRILVMEDNPSDVFLLRRALGEHGVDSTLEVVRDGEMALNIVERIGTGEQSPPDLIVLDLNLPRHDGIEVLTRCSQTPALSPVPVLILTSSDSPKERKLAEELGVTAFLRKPIMLDDFMALGGQIRQVLQDRRRAE